MRRQRQTDSRRCSSYSPISQTRTKAGGRKVITIKVDLEGDGAFSDIPLDQVITGEIQRVTCLEDGTKSGKPSVALLIALPDGRYVFAETTWALWETVTGALRGKLDG